MKRLIIGMLAFGLIFTALASSSNTMIDPLDANLEIFRISSNIGSEAIAPDQTLANIPIEGKTSILTSALMWGESVTLSVDGLEICGPASAAICVIEQDVFPGAVITSITFNANLIPEGYHKFTVEIFPMPSPGGVYTNTSDSIMIKVTPAITPIAD